MQRRTLNNKSSIGPHSQLAHDVKHYYPYGPYHNKTATGGNSFSSADSNTDQIETNTTNGMMQRRNKKKELQIRQINHKVQLFNRYLNEPQVNLNEFKTEDGKLKLQLSLNNNNNGSNNKLNIRPININNKRKGNNSNAHNNNVESNSNIILIKTDQSILTPRFNVTHSTLAKLQQEQETTDNHTIIKDNNKHHRIKPLFHIFGLEDLPIYEFDDFINHSDMILTKLQKLPASSKNIRTINTTTNSTGGYTDGTSVVTTNNPDNTNNPSLDDSIQFNDSFELSFDGKAIDRSDIFRMVDSFSVAFEEDDEEDPRINRFNNKTILTDDIIN